MKKILLLILATSILFSMSGIFVYADFAAGATVQSYDFENAEDASMFADKTNSASVRVTLNTKAGVGNSSANMLRIKPAMNALGYARFASFSTEYSKSTCNLFELELKLLKCITDDNSYAKIAFSRNSKPDTYSTVYTAGALVITKDTVEWWPEDNSNYKFTANISDYDIVDNEWFNLKILGNTGTANSFGKISILLNEKVVVLTPVAAIDTYIVSEPYTSFPMRTSSSAINVRSFNIQFQQGDTTSDSIDIDNIQNANGDGLVKLKDIEAQTLKTGDEKSINLNDYFFSYDGTAINYSIDKKFGTIENGVLTFNTSSEVSDTATLTAGNKTVTFGYTVKSAIDSATIATADNAFSSNDGESITVDGKTYNRYAMIFAKVTEIAGYELQEYGVLLMENAVPYVTSENAIKGIADKEKTTNEGAYGVLFEGTGIKQGATYYLRPYAIYKDSEGKITNIYGSSKKFTLNN